MTYYINKAAVVAEIERLITELVEEGEDTMFEQGRISAFEDVKVFINHTLEVKEVDLDIEVALWANAIPEMRLNDVERLAKYFYELGLKDKGE